MKRLLALSLLCAAAALHAAEPAYNESADARAEVKAALAEAAETQRSVLVVFGANWCPDCRILDAAFKQGPSAELVAKQFQVVKVNIGRYDKNTDLADSYGVDLKKGIPTIAILSPKGEVLHVTRDSELADARHMGDNGIYEFFKTVSQQPKS